MSPFFRIPLGIFVMVIGLCLVRYTPKIIEWFGEVPFAEEKFGAGGSYLFIKLLGTLISLIGVFIATNIISEMLTGLARFLTNS